MIKFIQLQLERRGPIFLGVLFAALNSYWGVDAIAYAVQSDWHLDVLYSSIFDLSSMAAAFLFAFFTFAKTTDTEFLRKLRETRTFRRFMGYLVVAMLSTAFLAVVTVPLMIANPKPEWQWDSVHCFQIFWSFVVGYATSATWRSTRQFVVLSLQD